MERGRYHRQEIVVGFGAEGQQKLSQACVLIVGCGALGSAAATYLVRAGIGELILIDDDVISLTNIHRQVLFDEDDVGKFKVDETAKKLQQANSKVVITKINARLSHSNAKDIIERCDIVLDGSDNFNTKYLVNDTAVVCNKPVVYGAVNRLEGQLSVFNVLMEDGKRSANMRNLFPSISASDPLGSCEENGVLGPVAGIIGNMLALECMKLITGIGAALFNRLLMVDALSYRFHFMKYDHRNEEVQMEQFGITWQEFRENFKTADYQLYDMREPFEIEQKQMGGIFLVANNTNFKNLPNNPIPVFHCVSGHRACKAFDAFKVMYPGAKAFYIEDVLPK